MLETTDASCFGENSGSVFVELTGGMNPFVINLYDSTDLNNPIESIVNTMVVLISLIYLKEVII